MKIALVIDGPLEQISGGYLYDRQLVDHLRSQGDEVEVVSLPAGAYLSRWEGNFDTGLVDRLAQGRADVILQDELSHPALFALNATLRRRTHAPIVSIVHHLRSSEPAPWPLPAFFRLIERRYLRSVQGFVFNSRATRGVVEELVGNRRPSVIASPAGDRLLPALTEDEITRRAHEPGPLRLLFVGNLVPRKGLITLLDALAALPPSLVRLEVVGDSGFDPGHAAAVRRRILRRNLANQVDLVGPLYDARLAARMAASQLLVVPSMYEGFGIVYLEGMGFGLPAIGGQAGGAAEIISDGENGFLIPPGDSASLAHRIRLMAENRSRLAAMSLAAQSTYRSHPTWAEAGATVRQFLADVTALPTAVAFPTLKEEVR